MHSIRRAAVAASFLAISPALRSQVARSAAVRSPFRAATLPLNTRQALISSLRSYATGPEDNAASQASESLKGTGEATKEFANEAASQASGSTKDTAEATQSYADRATSAASSVAQQATEAAQSATAHAADSIADTAGSVAAAAGSGPAPSSQSSPIRAEGTRPAVQPTSNLYVGNLYFEVSQNALKQEFERFGEVKNAKVVYDGRGLSKGFGYIEFATVDQAKAAMEALDQQVFEGRRMAVQYAISQGPKMPANNEQGFRHPPSRTLYIGNMSYEMSDKDLNDLFREIKNVTDVRVAIDRRTGQPRGYAHADFMDTESATKAAEYLKSRQFYGRTLRIDYTHSKLTSRVPAQ